MNGVAHLTIDDWHLIRRAVVNAGNASAKAGDRLAAAAFDDLLDRLPDPDDWVREHDDLLDALMPRADERVVDGPYCERCGLTSYHWTGCPNGGRR